jgi:hypothetical protein
MRRGMLLTPPSTRDVTRSEPSGREAPRSVNTCTTPFAAFEPYSEDAAAPLTTSTRSTSSGAISARPNGVMIPSTMNNGSCRPRCSWRRAADCHLAPGWDEVGTRRTSHLPQGDSALVPELVR